MKLLTFLFILGSLSIGFAGGMAFMAIFYKSVINDLRAQNRQLRNDNRYLKRLKADTVEIVYPKNEISKDVDFSKEW